MTTAEIVTDGRRSWVLDIPDAPIVTPNSRKHWSARKECAAVWRHSTAVLAKQARIPTLDRVSILLAHTPSDRRRRDPDRNSLVIKWCIDGLVDAGVIVDDDWSHVVLVSMRLDECREDRVPTWLLTVTEAP